MSGSPKYTQAEIKARKKAELEAALKKQAEQEARRSAEAAEKERQRQLQERQLSKAEQQLVEVDALIAGLTHDSVVMLWQGQGVEQLRQQRQNAQAAMNQKNFDQVTAIFKSIEAHSQTMIEAAYKAQLQADQRDFITDSIAQTLEQMGFSILYRQPEHADQPASAVILGAMAHSGNSINVSVPVEGKILYDVDGFDREATGTISSNGAASCDTAEKFLNDVHTQLAEAFDIEMEELTWDGKDPNRRVTQENAFLSTSQGIERYL